MPATPTLSSRATDHAKKSLFEDMRHMRFFIDEWILSDEPSHSLPVEMAEQRPGLGPILVHCYEEEFFDAFAEPRIEAEVAFIPASEIEAKRAAWEQWVRETAARNIAPGVVSYELAPNSDFFSSLVVQRLPWVPERIELGTRIRYDGVAHPLPGAAAIMLHADGEFELMQGFEDDDGTIWIEIRDIRSDELLYITTVQLLTATFNLPGH